MEHSSELRAQVKKDVQKKREKARVILIRAKKTSSEAVCQCYRELGVWT